jgi:hypothetical protein
MNEKGFLPITVSYHVVHPTATTLYNHHHNHHHHHQIHLIRLLVGSANKPVFSFHVPFQQMIHQHIQIDSVVTCKGENLTELDHKMYGEDISLISGRSFVEAGRVLGMDYVVIGMPWVIDCPVVRCRRSMECGYSG